MVEIKEKDKKNKIFSYSWYWYKGRVECRLEGKKVSDSRGK